MQVQQSAKMVQSLSFSHSGAEDSAADSSSALVLGDSDFVETFLDSLLGAAAVDSVAGAVAGEGVDLADPPQARSPNAVTTTHGNRI